MTSYHEFNKYDKAKVLVDKILGGMDVAVITDAGTPGISDPGDREKGHPDNHLLFKFLTTNLIGQILVAAAVQIGNTILYQEEHF